MNTIPQDLLATMSAPEPVRRPGLKRRVSFTEPLYGEVMDFLIDEAALLDEDNVAAWIGLLGEDLFYWMPTRQTVMRKAGPGFDPRMGYFYDTLTSIRKRVERITDFENAHSEDPPSRTRRTISALRLHETAEEGVSRAETNILLVRNRGEAREYDLISARRHDLLRRTPEGLRISQRIILVDQAVLGTPNMGIFL